MKILMTGATGFIGRELGKNLVRKGHDLAVLTRDIEEARKKLPFPCKIFMWDSMHQNVPYDAMQGVDAVVHLAGEPIAAKRWGAEQKEKILGSRVISTSKIVEAIQKNNIKTAVFASAIGFYGDRQDHEKAEELSESSSPGKGFLSEVCQEWEKPVQALPGSVRSVVVRIGLVLGQGGGMMEKVKPLFSLGLGGPLGSGDQWMSWIHVNDLVKIFEEAVINSKYTGPINGVAPQSVTNKDFTKALAKAVKRPAIFPAPALGLKIILGEMSELLLGSQKVSADKLSQLGFQFQYANLEDALEEVCGEGAGEERLVREQWLPKKVEEVFKFYSDATNLEKITPDWIHLKVKNISPAPIQKNTMIDYDLEVREIPLSWTSHITEWEPNKKFVDLQVKGPYAKWQHTHTFEPMKEGTLVVDEVRYRVPFSILGQILALLWVNRDVKNIFDARPAKIEEALHIHHHS